MRPDGTVDWDLPVRLLIDYGGEDTSGAPAFLIEDLDGDGIKEILMNEEQAQSGTAHLATHYIHLLRPNGQSYSAVWPRSLVHFGEALWPRTLVGRLHAGDLDGDGNKEVIFFEKGQSGADLPEEERGIGKIHAIRLDGSAAPGWPIEVNLSSGTVDVGDMDADGQAEILLDVGNGFVVYKGDGSSPSGWPVSTDSGVHRSARFIQADWDSQLEVLYYQLAHIGQEFKYQVGIIDHEGSHVQGFPVLLSEPNSRTANAILYSRIFVQPFALPRMLAVCYDKNLQIVDPNGSPMYSRPKDLGGRCRGLSVADVDNDGQVEFAVVILHFPNDQGFITSGHTDLEAFDTNGVPLSRDDDRWPIHLSTKAFYSGPGVLIEDVDLDGSLEVVNVRAPLSAGFDASIELLQLD